MDGSPDGVTSDTRGAIATWPFPPAPTAWNRQLRSTSPRPALSSPDGPTTGRVTENWLRSSGTGHSSVNVQVQARLSVPSWKTWICWMTPGSWLYASSSRKRLSRIRAGG
ncbi:MAG: hypothetical protein FJ087_23005, partial [Deltaproteobacteria bacterium]|nr:hypothetical protein [Deltaproteobacteria bacterium]